MQVTKTVYLIAKPVRQYNFEERQYEDTVSYMPWSHPSYGGTEAVASLEVTFEVPDNFNYHDLKLQELEREKKNIQAEFTKRLTEIQAQINEHLAIEAQ